MGQRSERKLSPRERLLATSTDLFPRFGIRCIGIDRILKEAGVAKASLYKNFRSKDDLIVAYINQQDAADRHRWNEYVDGLTHPKSRILALFDLALDCEPISLPGSYALAAAVEFPTPNTPGEYDIRAAVDEHRDWILRTITSQLHSLGLEDPDNVSDLASRLALTYEGAIASARLSKNSNQSITIGRSMAGQILDLISDPI